MKFIIKRCPGTRFKGLLRAGSRVWPCHLGRSGQRVLKREGDGATPAGSFSLKTVFYRPDRVARPITALPLRAIKPCDGWCDAPADRNYNRLVTHPYPASAERLWRDDRLYDIVVEIGYNDRPRIRGRGSAIFMHLKGAEAGPTEGCIAFEPDDLRAVLGLAHPKSVIISTF